MEAKKFILLNKGTRSQIIVNTEMIATIENSAMGTAINLDHTRYSVSNSKIWVLESPKEIYKLMYDTVEKDKGQKKC